MDRFPQPPDPPEEGNCRRCKRWITRDELLIDGCTECDDLLIEDMRKLWAGRPKPKRINIPWYQFGTRTCQGVAASPARYIPVDWRGLV